MNFVPGLDVPPHLAFGSGRGDNSRAVGNGAMAHLSAHVHSSEPDPDDFHCLIGQKLQVFNLGLESVVAAEIRHVEQLEKRPRVVNDDKATSSSSTASLLPTAAPRTLLNGAVVDGIPQVDESNATLLDRDESRSVVSETRSNLSQEFYDADEAEQFFRNMDSVPDIGLSRRGARCPVQGVFLSATGDQLYAPYLQRPFPLTDDIIAERRLVLSRQQASSSSSSSSSSTAAPLSTMPTINQRLEISQRFQRPKLHSDMRSFKAANPGATFEDFIRWYGNPSDVLADCGEMDSDSAMNELGGDELSTKSKLDRANEAIRALEQTRNFWTQTWDQALPIPAAEQEPLFDAESTVEMALDYLETIHPASLLCQVLAVNLSLSYFVLAASAGDAIHVRSVRVAIESLRATVDTALELLASDATMSIDNLQRKNSSPDMMASIEAIGACTRVCESLTAVEVIVSRAISLLRKLPQQYALVDTIMRHKEGTSVNVKVDAARSAFLHTARVQQKRVIKGNSKLKPAVREYMLRNTDDRAPCQLCVRTSDEGINVFGANQGGTVLALTKTINNGELPLPSTPVVKRQGSSGFFTI
jgi:Rab3 GTPase-activating protein catalytic subunit